MPPTQPPGPEPDDEAVGDGGDAGTAPATDPTGESAVEPSTAGHAAREPGPEPDDVRPADVHADVPVTDPPAGADAPASVTSPYGPAAGTAPVDEAEEAERGAVLAPAWPTDAPDPDPDEGLSHRERLERRLLGARRLALGTTASDRLWRWLGPTLVAVVAAALRLWNLGRPHKLVFDETYYVKNAYTMLRVGYEAAWPDKPNPAFEAGDVDTFLPKADYVVHPPLGKWMIALGMKAFGGAENPWSWRISTAVVGIVAVVLVCVVARRLFASTAVGIIAGSLMAVDGEAIVHSRTGLLDNFLMFWVLLAFVFLILDREQARRRLAARCAAILDAGGEIGRYGPRLGWRWWRFAAAVALGLSCGVKWSGLYFIAVFAVLSVVWDALARRAVGIQRWWEDAFLVDALPAALVMIPTAALTYLATWTSWFVSPDSYMRQWAAEHPGEGVSWLPPALRSLWAYHEQMWAFHNGLDSPHDYAAHPLGWIVQWRPTSFYWQAWDTGQHGCTADRCTQAITSIGNPVLWWAGAVSIIVAVVLLCWRRDWRASAALAGIVAGWLPWFAYAHRTIFTFYSIVFTPWVVLTVAYVIAVALEYTEHDRVARRWMRTGITVLLGVIGVVSVFFYPIWTAMQVPYWFWHLHMWLPSWV